MYSLATISKGMFGDKKGAVVDEKNTLATVKNGGESIILWVVWDKSLRSKS